MAAPKKGSRRAAGCAVRLYRESDPKPAIAHLARQLDVVRQDQADKGERADVPTTDMLEENRRRRQENAELCRVEILKAAGAYFTSEQCAI